MQYVHQRKRSHINRQNEGRHATQDECYNITVRNLASRAKTVLQLAGEMRDVYLENIRGFDNNPNFIINDSNLDIDKILKN